MNNEQKYKWALERIIQSARGNRIAMDDSFSREFTYTIENMARDALGLPAASRDDFEKEREWFNGSL